MQQLMAESTADRITRLPQRLEQFNERLERALLLAGRAASSVKLVAVSKTLETELVAAGLQNGLRHFGENYAQELAAKAEELRRIAPEQAATAQWHFIGHLQRNKVKYIAADTALFHALDSARLAAEFDKQATMLGRSIDVLIQVNTSGEDSKFGVAPAALPALMDEVQQLNSVRVKGLMTIAAPQERAEDARGEFSLLRRLLEQLADRRSEQHPLDELSMGMSHDFETAVAEGATFIRVGTALFGPR